MVTKNCAVCGDEFNVPKCREASAKFCSLVCKAKAAAELQKSNRPTLTCQHCGGSFNVPQSVASKGGKFCSKACHNSAMVGKAGTKRSFDGSLTGAPEGYLYERCEAHPRNTGGKVLQHRLVIEREMVRACPDHHFLETVGGVRVLRKDIHVHHKNEVKSDNRLENLVACTIAGHKCLHRGTKPMQGEVWPEPDEVEVPMPRRVESVCEKCGVSFSVKLSTWKLRGAKYCSNRCASGYEGDLPSKIERSCSVCGNQFLAKRHKVLNGTAKFCSNECRLRALHNQVESTERKPNG